jgi:hypothetical protein
LKIITDNHTIERALERGTNEDEIIDTINTGIEFKAKKNRIGKYKFIRLMMKEMENFMSREELKLFT